MNSRLQIGLIGAGRIGKIHAENLATRVRGVQLAAIADVNRAAAEQVAAEWNIPKVTDDARVLFEDKTMDAVVIASATETHVPFIIQAAASGKQIFCEKPIATDLVKIDRLRPAMCVRHLQAFRNSIDGDYSAGVEHPGALNGKLRDGTASPDCDRVARLDATILCGHVTSWENIRQEQHLLVWQTRFDLQRTNIRKGHTQIFGLSARKASEHM